MTSVRCGHDVDVGLGRVSAAAPNAVDRVTGDWGALFDSGIVVAAVLAVVLDLVLPGREGRTGEPPSPAEVVVVAMQALVATVPSRADSLQNLLSTRSVPGAGPKTASVASAGPRDVTRAG